MKMQISGLILALLAPASLAFTASVHPGRQAQSTRISTCTRSGTTLQARSQRDSDTALSAAFVESEDLGMDTTDISSSLLLGADIDEEDKAYLQDGFVFGLEGSGLGRPKGKVANIVVEGDSLETQSYQVAAVAATFVGLSGFASVNYMDLLATNGGDVAVTSAQTTVLAVTGWLLADLGSGVFHWSVDNYGNGKTPVMGSIIAAFQGHHSAPWTITERGFCNNVYKLCIPFGIVPMTLINFLAGPAVTIFFAVFCAMEIMSQELHKWSHMTKGQCPGYVNFLQDVGLAVGRTTHARHHLAPYEGNYCIVSGIWNKPLDESGIFRWMEHMVYNLNGVEANAWKLDADLRERTLRGDYSLPKARRKRASLSSSSSSS